MTVQAHLDLLEQELDQCEALRAHTLASVSDSSMRSLIYESILIRAARSHENFIESVFISYLLGETTAGGDIVGRYATPSDRAHARKLLSVSSARFIDWSEAETVRTRSAAFFEPDSPLYTAASAKSSELAWIKKVRNQAAHDSIESRLSYKSVVGHVLVVSPTLLPSAGEFLQSIPASGQIRNREILAFFIESLREFARTSAGAAPAPTV
jgi:hypothetical protein